MSSYLGDFDRSGRDAANSLKEKLDRFSEELLFNIIFETLAANVSKIMLKSSSSENLSSFSLRELAASRPDRSKSPR